MKIVLAIALVLLVTVAIVGTIDMFKQINRIK
jgi:hypothetical protein